MSGLAIKSYNNALISVPTTPETVAAAICGCNSACFYKELVFADNLASGDHWKEDKTDLIYRKVVASDTITIKLYKNCSLVATITDQTYGDYYPSFTDDSLLVGFLADWTKIFNAFSGGTYQFKTDVTILGSSYTIESREFLLQAYDDTAAHRTVKIESYQTGNILRSEFDYSNVLTDLPNGWYSSIRIEGKFGQKTPTLEEDNYFNSSYELFQNRPSVNYSYTLDTNLIPETLATVISSDTMLSNTILLTDYNQNNNEILRRISVVPESFEDTTYYFNGKLRYIIKFKDKTQNIIKRNF